MVMNNNKVLVLGATGATGYLVTQELLERGEEVVTLVRSASKLQALKIEYPGLTVIEGTVLAIDAEKLKSILSESKAIISCLGHNMSFKGVYGKPRKLVADTVKLICRSLQEINLDNPVRLVLMNTTGYRNGAIDQPRAFKEKLIIGLLRGILPPHTDNEAASDYLITVVGNQATSINWVIVRPDTLIDEDRVTEYSLFDSPVRSPLFNPGKTSRINAAHFMSELAIDSDVFKNWQHKTPVIYNSNSLDD